MPLTPTLQALALTMNQPRYRPEAFLLDLDGVLVDSAEVHLVAYREAFKAHGLEFPSEAGRLVSAGAPRGRVLQAARAPSELVSALAGAKEAAVLRSIESGALLPSRTTVGFLKQLAEAQCPAALVSNSMTARAWTKASGVEWAFSAIVDGELASKPKPAPDGFLLAAKLLGVPAPDCVAVDDSPIGVEAARLAGTFVVGVGDQVRSAHVDYSVADLGGIPLDGWLELPPPPGETGSDPRAAANPRS